MNIHPYNYPQAEVVKRVIALQSNCPQLCKVLGDKNVEAIVTNHLYSLHDYAFENLKQRIHKTMSSDDHNFTTSNIKKVISELEEEYSQQDECLRVIGIEPDSSIDAFAEGQVRWLNEHFQFHN